MQQRERVIIISTRDDLNVIPSFPKHENKLINIKEALKDIKPETIKIPSKYFLELLQLSKRGQSLSKVHPKGHCFGSYLLDCDKQAPTILKGSGNGFFVPYKNTYRYLAPNELARIQSFPKNYKWIGSWTDKVNRIGNSVPPMMMKAIAEHVYEKILKT